MNKKLLKNGSVIRSGGQSKKDILVENNKIAAIGDDISVSLETEISRYCTDSLIFKEL